MLQAIAEHTIVSVTVSIIVAIWLGRQTYRRTEMVISGVITTLVTELVVGIFLYTNFVTISEAKLMEAKMADDKADANRVELEILEHKREEALRAEARATLARLNKIKKIMSTIQMDGTPCEGGSVPISKLEDGLDKIADCPSEEDHYLETADWLVENIKDYEAAAFVLGRAIDILRQESPSLPICNRLKKYYEHLENKPRLDENCIKIHES